jgi:hypothetical protein
VEGVDVSETRTAACSDHVVIQFAYRPRFEDWDGRVDEGRAITVVCERDRHRKGMHRRGKVEWLKAGGTKVWLR